MPENQHFKVRDYQEKDFTEIYQILQDSFPKEECPDSEQIALIMERPILKIKIFENVQGELLGLCLGHDFSEFFFCDYLVIRRNYRNQGYGGHFLKYIIRYFKKPIILECEPPDFSNMAFRRLRFYQRTGFTILTKHYKMPGFALEDHPMPMYLMAANASNTEIYLNDMIRKIYQTVYAHIIDQERNQELLPLLYRS